MNDNTSRQSPDRRGLRTAFGLACRRFLREESGTADHPLDCELCRNHVAARERLAVLLRQRPESPQELHSPGLLSAVFERHVAGVEAGAMGTLLRQGLPVHPAANDHEDAADLLESPLARAIMRRPASPSVADWHWVRAGILSNHGLPTAAATVGTDRRRWYGFAAVAAAAIICGMLLSDGTSSAPTIVFTDVASMPDVDFVVLRHGIPR